MISYSLTQTIGDCLVAGGAIERKAKDLGQRIGFHTNPLVAQFFQHSPCIKHLSAQENCQPLHWASKQKDLFRLNYLNRFGAQIGVNCANHDNLTICDENGPVYHTRKNETIVINQSSSTPSHRSIDEKYIDFIKKLLPSSYELVFVGKNCYGPSVLDINQISDLLKSCALFIGPVSFPYHLGQCYRTPMIPFFGFTTEINFSHGINVYPVNPTNSSCAHLCEEHEHTIRPKNNCTRFCPLLQNYSFEEIALKLEQAGIIK